MKTLKNVQFDLILDVAEDGTKNHATVAKLSQVCLNAPAKDGFTADDMRKTIKIMDLLDGAKLDKNIELEDVDAQYLKDKVTNYKWGAIHKDLLAFTDLVGEL